MLAASSAEVITGTPGRYWHRLDDGRVQCDVCPRLCKLQEGQRGLCFVRARRDDGIVLTTYGRSSGFCIDPIEKKPLAHFLPGSAVLSFGTAGCNLACRFCQNWDISKAREVDRLQARASPEEIAAAAVRAGCRSVAFTYNDPVIFLEYAVDVAQACRERGLRNVAVTAGYVCPEPRRELFAHMDAANVDLKAFTEDFYHRLCTGRLQPVLDTLRLPQARDRSLARGHDPAHPGRERRPRRDRGAERLVRGEPGAGRAAALHRVPPGLQDARHAAHPGADPARGTADRHGAGAAPRLHRQHPRRGLADDPLPRLRCRADRPRLAPDHGLVAERGWPVPSMRRALPRGVRRPAPAAGASAAGPWRSARPRARHNRDYRGVVTARAAAARGPDVPLAERGIIVTWETVRV